MRSNEKMSSQMRSYREPLGDGKRQKRFFRRWSRSCLNGESQGKPGTVSDITENPHKYQFKQIDDTTGPRILNSVDAVIISNSVAFDGGLNVLKDSIYHETINKNTRYNINIIATAKKNENNKECKKLVKLFHSKKIQEYVGKKFDHTKVEVKKPVSYLK